MTNVAAYKAICDRLLASSWPATYPTVAIVLENEANDEPVGYTAGYLTLEVTEVPGGGQQTLGPTGARLFRRVGQLIMEIHAPLDVGTKLPREMGEAARAVFEGTSFSGVTVFDCDVKTIGAVGRWYLVQVVCDLDFYDTK